MRAVLLALFISLASAALADLPKPARIDDTLALMLDRILPQYPDARIDPVDRNIKPVATGSSVVNPDNIHSLLHTMDDGTARTAGMQNLTARLHISTIEEDGGIFMIWTDGFYESSLMLEDGPRRSLAMQLGDDIIAVVSARDLLLFAAAADTASVDRLDIIRADVLANGAHTLSEMVYIWQDSA